MTSTGEPYLSVIVPVHQGQHVLPRSLGALAASTLSRREWELILVDDGSTDESDLVAAAHADTVVRLPGKPQGPAYARNRGFEVARGEIIVFIDADVCVHADTLASFAKLFRSEPGIGAAFGSYDADPPAKGFVSQYRNLLHHYHHQINPGDAETFWAGCGAIRASVFAAAEMYDEWHFSRPQIEDIELGHRIRALGHRIVLRPDIQCAHLKRWTLRNMISTDLKDRGVPWARLLASQGSKSSRTLNLKTVEKVSTALVWFALIFTLFAAWFGRKDLLIGTFASLVPVLVVNRPLYGFFERTKGFAFAVGVVPLHVLYYVINGIAAGMGWFLHQLVGGPAPHPTVEAFAEIGLKRWPPVPVKRDSAPW